MRSQPRRASESDQRPRWLTGCRSRSLQFQDHDAHPQQEGRLRGWKMVNNEFLDLPATVNFARRPPPLPSFPLSIRPHTNIAAERRGAIPGRVPSSPVWAWAILGNQHKRAPSLQAQISIGVPVLVRLSWGKGASVPHRVPLDRAGDKLLSEQQWLRCREPPALGRGRVSLIDRRREPRWRLGAAQTAALALPCRCAGHQ